MNKTVSLCMIVKNEEKNLSRCLKSIDGLMDEIIIVDTGSTDKTIEIAKAYNAKIYHYEWQDDFSAARNESIKYATGDWLFFMDADDELCHKDRERLLELIQKGAKDIYFFETHSFVGRTPGANITVNLNIRLVKNDGQYYYESPIHEQLKNKKQALTNLKTSIVDIKIFHYGYLKENISSKNKRERNKSILQDLMKKEPNNMFHYFNLGSEYFAENNYIKALECFNQVYKNFDEKTLYAPKLILRMVLCCYFLGLYEEGIELVEIGLLKYYPKYTELEYLKGLIYHKQKKYTLAIDAFNKCIQMKDSPSALKFIFGVGDYRSFAALADIYMALEDYYKAYEYAVKTLLYKKDYAQGVYHLVKILKAMQAEEKDVFKIMESHKANGKISNLIIGDALLKEGYHTLASQYIQLEKKESIHKDTLKAKYLFKSKAYEEVVRFLEHKPFTIDTFKMLSLSLILLKDEKIFKYLETIEDKEALKACRDLVKVYGELAHILFEQPTAVISYEKKERVYTQIIMEILNQLLQNNEFDVFEKALELLNLISDDTVLLQLGKLYHKNGYEKMAYKEIIRSIKDFDVIDKEGLRILEQCV
ncbi:tetratricopeptide repeat protein [Natranaerovirga hydrolytica]|uniref:Tetratricopeptide repeat protein n=1 Tax=Natranaerovirga hydrolytica TaxID=680378 RepID=A0A4R1N7H3_9FIRM|nr:TPR domain-containing glycosyltransferase [Natranaerovirga hydrolytica]TCK98613.1 tetratricopeptide repeat protein [Natranaerovirga hydrolytica]